MEPRLIRRPRCLAELTGSAKNVCLAAAVCGIAGAWPVAAAPTGPLVVQNVQLRPWKKGLLVSGTVGRREGYDYLAGMDDCLRIDVLDQRGHVIKRVFTHYLPQPVPATYRGLVGRSTYAAFVCPAPPPGGTVTVTPQSGARTH